MRTRFNTKWTDHLQSPQEKEAFKKSVLASRTALDRLVVLIEKELKTLDNQETSLEDYSNSAWSHKQAHRNGERGFAKKILNLLSFNE